MACHAWDGCFRCARNDIARLRFLTLVDGYCRPIEIPWGPIAGGATAFVLLSIVVGCALSGPRELRQAVPTYDHDEVTEHVHFSKALRAPPQEKELF